MDDEDRHHNAAMRLLDACASGHAAPLSVLPSLNARAASILLRHICAPIGERTLNDKDAIAVSLAVKCVLKAINTTVSGCSAEIKANIARCCTSLCSGSIRILLPSATSIVQCFALLPIDFDCMHNSMAASDFDKTSRAREIDLIGQRAQTALQEAMSSEPAPPQAAVASLGIMLSVLRRIDHALLMSVFDFLARCGNFSACRSLARVQEPHVQRCFLTAAKHGADREVGEVSGKTVRLAQSLLKFTGAIDGEFVLSKTQQQKDTELTAQQANVSRLLRANKIAIAALYSSQSVQHSSQLQRHMIRVLCSMKMPQEAASFAEKLNLRNDTDIMRMLQECSMSTRDLGITEGHLQLPDDFQVLIVNDASDPQQAAAVASIFGIVGEDDATVPVVAVDVEWPCSTWEGSGRASIMQVASAHGCAILDLHGICSSGASIAAFSDVMTRLLMSNGCIKLFYGFEQDMAKLRTSWPDVSAFGIGACCCLELNHVAATIRADVRNKSLSDVCLAFLGQSLDKSQRLSDWGARPLSPSQITYAAIDVYAPLLVFSRLSSSESVAVSPSFANSKCFESLVFNVQAVNISQNGSKMMPHASESSSALPHLADSVHAETHDALGFKVHVLQESVNSINVVPSSDELTVTDRRDHAAMPMNPPDCVHSLGTREVVTALGKCGEGLVFQLMKIPAEAESGSYRTDSKFEVFDRIQSHADAVGMARCQVLKTLCIVVKQGSVFQRFAVVMIGDMFLDLSKVAGATGCCRRNVQLAPATRVLPLFGYRVGAVPPVGFLPGDGAGTGVGVLMDKSVHDLGSNCSVLVGGGESDTVLKISVSNLLHVIKCGNAKSPMGDVDPVHDLCRSAGSADLSGSPDSLPISLKSSVVRSTSSVLRFACDPSIAKAGKWLRAMGVDCILIDSPSIDAIQSMLAEQRIFLSSDRKLLDKREFQNSAVVLVLGTDAKDQLLEIVRHFDIVYNPERFLVRCVFCNTEDFKELSPEMARDLDTQGSIPARVFAQVPSFQMCTGCKRIFWKGPKFKNTEEYLLDILKKQDLAEK